MKTRIILTTGLLFVAGLMSGMAFTPVKATYTGLFYENSGYWQQNSGFISIQTTSKGAYSASLVMGNQRYSCTGWFDGSGATSQQILRRYQEPLTLSFQVQADDPDLIMGTLTDGTWVADVIADRMVFDGKQSVCSDAGQYTLWIPGDLADTNHPGGDSFGAITVDKKGRIKFVGTLADGYKVSQSATVSKGGQWPLYIPVYRGEGSLHGWLLFNASAEEDLSGDVTWIKLENPREWYYPDGFALTVTAYGSSYVRPPKGARVLDLTQATIEFNGGNLDRGVTNSISLDTNNRVNNLSANKLSMKISLSNGTFSGRVQHPITWDWISFKGVVLQRYNTGAGFFPGWDQTGEVWLQPEQ